MESERERIRRVIARELTVHIHTFNGKGQSFNVEKYFDRLKADGYKITKHLSKETGSIRGYSLEKYGFYFHASEVRREFALKCLGEPLMRNENNKGKLKMQNRKGI